MQKSEKYQEHFGGNHQLLCGGVYGHDVAVIFSSSVVVYARYVSSGGNGQRKEAKGKCIGVEKERNKEKKQKAKRGTFMTKGEELKFSPHSSSFLFSNIRWIRLWLAVPAPRCLGR